MDKGDLEATRHGDKGTLVHLSHAIYPMNTTHNPYQRNRCSRSTHQSPQRATIETTPNSYVRSHVGVSSHQRERIIDVVVMSMGNKKPISVVNALGNRVRALVLNV